MSFPFFLEFTYIGLLFKLRKVKYDGVLWFQQLSYIFSFLRKIYIVVCSIFEVKQVSQYREVLTSNVFSLNLIICINLFLSHYFPNIVKIVILIYQHYKIQIHEIYILVCVLCFVSLMLPSYSVWILKNYLILFEHKLVVTPFPTTYCKRW